MTCPKCNGTQFEEDVDEVDIGVGVQTYLRGGTCATCGDLSVCPACGSWDFQPHRAWCGSGPLTAADVGVL